MHGSHRVQIGKICLPTGNFASRSRVSIWISKRFVKFATYKPNADHHQNLNIMKVIWTSLQDTKTQTRKKIIAAFGYNKFYDFTAAINDNKDYETWNKTLLDGTAVDWKSFLEGYDAMTQSIGIHYFKEIISAFPDAKVIIEDISEDEYIIDLRKFQRLVRLLSYLRFNLRLSRAYSLATKSNYLIFKGNTSDENVKQVFRDFKKEVINTVPKENLLIINPNMGWEQLSSFLNKPTPSFPFPLTTSASDVTKIRSIFLKSYAQYWYVYALYFGTLIGIVIYLLFFYEG